jgi:hypothetical protein
MVIAFHPTAIRVRLVASRLPRRHRRQGKKKGAAKKKKGAARKKKAAAKPKESPERSAGRRKVLNEAPPRSAAHFVTRVRRGVPFNAPPQRADSPPRGKPT